MRRKGHRRRKTQGPARDPSLRAKAKALLREAGEALEKGDEETGGERLEAALAADPSFVEPGLVLAKLRDSQGEDAIADALIEETVRRGAAQVDRIAFKPGGPAWWYDEATRPYMKALVARGWRRLERDEPAEAAEHFRKVFDMAAEEDPLEAGLFAAESYLYAGSNDAALAMFQELEESPGVCYGRALAYFRTDGEVDGLVSAWLGILLNAWVAAGLASEASLTGIERKRLVGDQEEADEILGRTNDLWTDEDRAVLDRLLRFDGLRDDLEEWAMLVMELDRAKLPQATERALSQIEDFLSPQRLRRAVDAFLEGGGSAPPTPTKLPVVS